MRKQKAFIKTHLTPLVMPFVNLDETLTLEDIKKILDYYALNIPVVLGEGYRLLRGKNLTKKERLALTYLGACSGLFDDFYDEHRLPQPRIVSMLLNPEAVTPQSANEQLFISLYRKGLSYVHNEPSIKAWFLKIAEAQEESQRQQTEVLTQAELLEITENKGAYSVLFYRHVFDSKPSKKEATILFRLGAIAQLEDDIFDVYKDFHDNIKTLPNTLLDADHIEKLYQEWNQEVLVLAKDLPYPQSQITDFLNFHNLIYARGLVCLDRFKEVQKNYNGVFDPAIISRKELICDMESPNSRWRLMRYL